MTPAVPLYPYQHRWVRDDSRFKVGMFARQCGKTFTSTLELAIDCVEAEARRERRRWVILSRGERQARLAMDEGVKLHLQAMKASFKANAYEWEPQIKAHEVHLPGGSVITALPANPDTARGFSANVLLDEFAFHKDSRAIWKALFPVISRKGLKLRVISTPNGKGNKFYDLVTGKSKRWSRHVVDIYQAVKDGLPRDIEELREGAGDEDLWAQEFELQFLDEASAWLTFEMISAVEDDDAGRPNLYQGGPCYIGNDIAARNDLWVAWVWELVGDVLWTREIVELPRGASFAEHDRTMDELMRRYRVVRLAMDQTGMGEKPVQDAQRRYGQSVVEGVLLSPPRRLTVATAGKSRFEDRRCRIPSGNPKLRADLHKLKKIEGATGAARLVADRDSEGHADRTWAAFLGIAAADDGARDYAYTPVSSGRSGGLVLPDDDEIEHFGRVSTRRYSGL